MGGKTMYSLFSLNHFPDSSTRAAESTMDVVRDWLSLSVACRMSCGVKAT